MSYNASSYLAAPQSFWARVIRNRLWIFGVVAAIASYVLASASLFYVLEPVHRNSVLYSNYDGSFWSAIYFTVVNLTTVGFGDIAPTIWQTRFLAIANSIAGVISFGFLVAVITSCLHKTKSNRSPTTCDTPEADERAKAVGEMIFRVSESIATSRSSLKCTEFDIYLPRETSLQRDVLVSVHVKAVN